MNDRGMQFYAEVQAQQEADLPAQPSKVDLIDFVFNLMVNMNETQAALIRGEDNVKH